MADKPEEKKPSRREALYDHASSKRHQGDKKEPAAERQESGAVADEMKETPAQQRAEDKAGTEEHPAAALAARHKRERETMNKAHEGERRDMHGNHREEMRKMAARHEKAHADLAKRHAAEMAGGGEESGEPQKEAA